MRKYFIFLFLLVTVFLVITYGQFQSSRTALSENKTIAKESDDFILHVQVNDDGEEIEVLHSIQYKGKKKVEIQHQTPLVSVSLHDHNHDFTGSYVKKSMEEGNIYRPQKAANLPLPSEDECNLYIQAKFTVNDEWKVINHVEELKFK
ncbi:hypothetical protein [Virgibacillus kimchii]